MNKKLAMSVLVIIGVFGMSHVAFADPVTACGNPALSDMSTTYVSCGGGNPATVMGGWGTTNGGVPAVAQGQTVTDDLGMSSTCQFFIGCVDIYHTQWYLNQIAALRTQLGDTAFQYWVSLVKNK